MKTLYRNIPLLLSWSPARPDSLHAHRSSPRVQNCASHVLLSVRVHDGCSYHDDVIWFRPIEATFRVSGSSRRCLEEREALPQRFPVFIVCAARRRFEERSLLFVVEACECCEREQIPRALSAFCRGVIVNRRGLSGIRKVLVTFEGCWVRTKCLQQLQPSTEAYFLQF